MGSWQLSRQSCFLWAQPPLATLYHGNRVVLAGGVVDGTICEDCHTLCALQVFFKQWRHLDAAKRPKPVMVHVNYHPEKGERMKSIVEYFDSGDAAAIMKWPGGSEKGS